MGSWGHGLLGSDLGSWGQTWEAVQEFPFEIHKSLPSNGLRISSLIKVVSLLARTYGKKRRILGQPPRLAVREVSQASMTLQRGYDPRISSRSHRLRTASIAFWTWGSDSWPSMSMKNRYEGSFSPCELGIGNDSIQVRLTPNFSNGEIVLTSDPTWLGSLSMSDVLSRPVRCSATSAMTAKRVTLCNWSSIFSVRMLSRYAWAAERLATAAANSSRWASSAAAAVETTSTLVACGRFFPSQLRHCDSACDFE